MEQGRYCNALSSASKKERIATSACRFLILGGSHDNKLECYSGISPLSPRLHSCTDTRFHSECVFVCVSGTRLTLETVPGQLFFFLRERCRAAATHGECHSCSHLKPTWRPCEGELLPSDTNNAQVRRLRAGL